MGLQEAVQHFQQYTTNPVIAFNLGVTKGQVMKYASGKTKSCSDTVVDKFYDNFSVDGCRVLLDYYPNEAVYMSSRLLREPNYQDNLKPLVASESGLYKEI